MVRIGAICRECKKYYRGEICPNCKPAEKNETINILPDYHDEYYDQGLGEVVKSRKHRKQLMKEKGLTEVGNEWKYVDPAEHRKKIDKRTAKLMADARNEAHRILQKAGAPEWN